MATRQREKAAARQENKDKRPKAQASTSIQNHRVHNSPI